MSHSGTQSTWGSFSTNSLEGEWQADDEPSAPPKHYPEEKSPIVPSTERLEDDWILMSKQHATFAATCSFTQVLNDSAVYKAKCRHMQMYFWTALDRHNRSGENSQPKWEYYDMRGMLNWFRLCFKRPPPMITAAAHTDGLWQLVLLNSPWWDCPVFKDLLEEPVLRDGQPMKDENGVVKTRKRNPRNEALEQEFLDRWWMRAAALPLRRFANGDAVLPITYHHYISAHGAAAAGQWWIVNAPPEPAPPPEVTSPVDVSELGYSTNAFGNPPYY